MDWTRATTSEIDGAINRLRIDRDAWQHQREDAADAKQRALAMVDNATAAECEARRHVRDDDLEIDRLLEERAQIPDQRPPS